MNISEYINVQEFSPDEWFNARTMSLGKHNKVTIREVERRTNDDYLYFLSSLKYFQSFFPDTRTEYILCDLNEGHESQRKQRILDLLELRYEMSASYGGVTRFYRNRESREKWIGSRKRVGKRGEFDYLIKIVNFSEIFLYCSLFWKRGYWIFYPFQREAQPNLQEIRELFEIEDLQSLIERYTDTVFFTRPDWMNFTLISSMDLSAVPLKAE